MNSKKRKAQLHLLDDTIQYLHQIVSDNFDLDLSGEQNVALRAKLRSTQVLLANCKDWIKTLTTTDTEE